MTTFELKDLNFQNNSFHITRGDFTISISGGWRGEQFHITNEKTGDNINLEFAEGSGKVAEFFLEDTIRNWKILDDLQDHFEENHREMFTRLLLEGINDKKKLDANLKEMRSIVEKEEVATKLQQELGTLLDKQFLGKNYAVIEIQGDTVLLVGDTGYSRGGRSGGGMFAAIHFGKDKMVVRQAQTHVSPLKLVKEKDLKHLGRMREMQPSELSDDFLNTLKGIVFDLGEEKRQLFENYLLARKIVGEKKKDDDE